MPKPDQDHRVDINKLGITEKGQAKNDPIITEIGIDFNKVNDIFTAAFVKFLKK